MPPAPAEHTPPYRELLEKLRGQFPQPVSDPVHDAYVVFSILRALDQVDALKGQSAVLGQSVEPNFVAAGLARVEQTPRTLEQVIPELVPHLEGMPSELTTWPISAGSAIRLSRSLSSITARTSTSMP